MPPTPTSPEPPDPPPTPPTTRAIRNLFTPATPVPPDILRSITWAAVVAHRGQASGKFSVASFGEAVRDRFDLREPPGEAWCRDVLEKLEYVTAYPGGYYRVQTG